MINESLKNESLINKLDENMISEKIFEYLYLEDINHLSQTNKKINQLFKKSIKNNSKKNGINFLNMLKLLIILLTKIILNTDSYQLVV